MRINKVTIIISILILISIMFLSLKGVNNEENEIEINLKDSILCQVPSYSNYIKLPHGLKGYFDYDEGFSCALYKEKPYLVFFSTIESVECLEIESTFLSDLEISKLINENFIFTALWKDDNLKFKEKFYEISKLNGDTIKTLGEKNTYYQMKKFNENVQPVFYILNSKEELLVKPYYYTTDRKSFIDFLKKGIEKYKKNP